MRVFVVVAFLFSITLAARISSRSRSDINIDLTGLEEKLKNAKIELPSKLVVAIKEVFENDAEQTLISGGRDGSINAIINEYADEIFENIRQLILDLPLDPLGLPDETLDAIVAKLALTNGSLTELATIRRGGDLVVQYSSSARQLKLDVPIGFDDLIIDYNYKTTVLLVSIHGGVNGVIQDVTADVVLGFDFITYYASLESFELNVGKIRLTFTGHDLIDWLIDAVSGVVTTFFRGLIVAIVERVIKSPIENVIDTINSIIDKIFHATTTTAAPDFAGQAMYSF